MYERIQGMLKCIVRHVSAVLFVWVAGCASDTGNDGSGDPGGDGHILSKVSKIVDDVCRRFDTCNVLEGSIEDCVQRSDKNLGELTPNQLADLETQTKQCLDFKSCDAFEGCIQKL
jgi:hypothetical protein